MARRKKIVEKEYDKLIKTSEETIAKLTKELKDEKINLRQLKKDKANYDEVKDELEKQAKIQKAAELIAASGKSLDEIEVFLSSK